MNRKLPADISLWDEECMRIFIEDNSAMFRVFASRYVADPDAIDDFLQEAYIRLWTHRAAIGQVASLRNYFFTLLHHIIMDKQSYLSRRISQSMKKRFRNCLPIHLYSGILLKQKVHAS